jgi:hypothetical protein
MDREPADSNRVEPIAVPQRVYRLSCAALVCTWHKPANLPRHSKAAALGGTTDMAPVPLFRNDLPRETRVPHRCGS